MYTASLSVDTAASSYDLVDLATVKAELGLSVSTYDTALSLYISSESQKIEHLCNRVFAEEAVTETFRLSEGTGAVALSRVPVQTVTAITLDGETLDPSLYNLETSSGVLWSIDEEGCPTLFLGSVLVVSYEGGYSSIPPALKDACLRQVSSRWYARAKDPSVRVEEVAGVGRQEYWVGPTSDGLPPDVEASLSAFKRRTVG